MPLAQGPILLRFARLVIVAVRRILRTMMQRALCHVASQGFIARRVVALLLACLSACGQGEVEAPAADRESATASTEAADGWLGRWNGPEGTYLEIARRDSSFELVISDLDGPRTFAAYAVAGGLSFERNGVVHTIRATDGAGTGMKWLADRKNCLVVKPGEGFCRE